MISPGDCTGLQKPSCLPGALTASLDEELMALKEAFHFFREAVESRESKVLH